MPDKAVSDKMSVKQRLALLCLGLVCVLFTAIIFAPAIWLNTLLQMKTDGRVVLGDPEGSLWNGSALIGVAMNKDSDLTSIVPGRFNWHLSPILLLGQIELLLENSDALQQPVHISGNLRHAQVSPGSLALPAKRLSGLGAPLNTVKPSGDMTLSWDALGLTFLDGSVAINGAMRLGLQNMASALSPIKPLGSYMINFVWRGKEADIDLKTEQGPMLLSGNGVLAQGHLQFSGQAQAQAGQEENLANLLNLLGQRRLGADRNVIALEFK